MTAARARMRELLSAGATRVEALRWLCLQQAVGFDVAMDAYLAETGSTCEALRDRIDPGARQKLDLAEISIRHAENEPLASDGTWAHFVYVDFWDVPRCIALLHRGWLVTLEAPFREDRDEYDDHYEIHALDVAGRAPTELGLLPTALGGREFARSLGRVRVAQVRFDRSRRRAVDLRASGLEMVLGGLVR